MAVKSEKNTVLEFLFGLKGNEVPILAVESGTIVSATAQQFVATVNKLSYLLWLVANCMGKRTPVEATPKSGTIAAGTLALNFNAATDKEDIVAYEIYFGFSDNTAPGSIDVSHAYLDMFGTANTFLFTVNPDFSKSSGKQMKVFYLATAGVGSKFYPLVHFAKQPVPVVGGATIETTNAFTITGPNDVRVVILPVVVSSIHLYYLLNSLPRMLFRYLRGLGMGMVKRAKKGVAGAVQAIVKK